MTRLARPNLTRHQPRRRSTPVPISNSNNTSIPIQTIATQVTPNTWIINQNVTIGSNQNFTNDRNNILVNYYDFTNNGEFQNSGTFLTSGGTFTNNGKIVNDNANFFNTGNLVFNPNGVIYNRGGNIVTTMYSGTVNVNGNSVQILSSSA
jgi:hypothetical protein